jgi:hypothetical protein
LVSCPLAAACAAAADWPPAAAPGQLRGQVTCELLDDLPADFDHDAPAELGGPPGDAHRRVHGDPRLVAAQILEGRPDGGRRRASATGLLAGRLKGDHPGLLILLSEPGRAGIGQRDGPDLHLDPALDDVTVEAVDGGAGHARRHPLDIEQDFPGPLRGHRDGERVLKFHIVRL